MRNSRILRYLALFAVAVLAAPFFRTVTSSINSAGALIVRFDERGLGGNDVVYTLQATADATVVCCNNGGHQPAATNKVTSVNVGAATTIPVAKNGRIVAAITAGPPPTPEFCPNGQKEVVSGVKYVSVTLIDLTNSVTAALPDVSLSPNSC